MNHIVKNHEESIKEADQNKHHQNRDNNRDTYRRNEGQQTKNLSRRQIFTRVERSDNGFCVHWNNGSCEFGEFCRYIHEDSPFCYFQEKCNRKGSCRFFHAEQSFLAQRSAPWQSS